MASVLQGVVSPNAGQSLLDAFSAGQNIRAQGQMNQMRQQQIGEGDYASALRKMQIANKLAKKAITLPPEGRAQLMRDYSGALQSVGFTTEDLAGTPLDDAGLQNLIAQTDSVLSSVMPEAQANQQFGAQETLKDEKGNLFFATSRRDPSTGEVIGVVAAADGSDKKPVGQLSVTGAYGQTAQERVGQIGAETGARTQAQQNVRAETEPKIQAAIASAKEMATAEAQKRIAQTGQLGKLEDATAIYNRLRDSDLDIIYGRGEQWYPDFLRSQRGIDLIADRDQLIGMLQLGARGELKGQGPITEGEQKILSNSVTALGNPNISKEKAKQALDDAMKILSRNSGQQFNPPLQQDGSGQGAMTPGINEQPKTVNWGDLP